MGRMRQSSLAEMHFWFHYYRNPTSNAYTLVPAEVPPTILPVVSSGGQVGHQPRPLITTIMAYALQADAAPGWRRVRVDRPAGSA